MVTTTLATELGMRPLIAHCHLGLGKLYIPTHGSTGPGIRAPRHSGDDVPRDGHAVLDRAGGIRFVERILTRRRRRHIGTGAISKSKLAAILSADVVGCSRLMAADEAATVATRKDYRAVVGRVICRRGDRVVNAPGDALLAEFPSAVEAVQSAVEIQQVLAVLDELAR